MNNKFMKPHNFLLVIAFTSFPAYAGFWSTVGAFFAAIADGISHNAESSTPRPTSSTPKPTSLSSTSTSSSSYNYSTSTSGYSTSNNSSSWSAREYAAQLVRSAKQSLDSLLTYQERNILEKYLKQGAQSAVDQYGCDRDLVDQYMTSALIEYIKDAALRCALTLTSDKYRDHMELKRRV